MQKSPATSYPSIVELPRYSFGKEVYRYKILAREAVYKRDFERIAELEQYHYVSQKSRVALRKCYDCGRLIESNTKPKCECGSENVHIVEIKGSTLASRFLIFELRDKFSFEPDIVAYVRVDPLPSDAPEDRRNCGKHRRKSLIS